MNELFDYVRNVFANEALQCAPADLVNRLRISERSKEFLTTIGLPQTILLGGGERVFDLTLTLPTLREIFPDWVAAIDRSWDDYRVLSLQFGTVFVLNVADGGSIWWGSSSSDMYFVNSSVELFGWFLAGYARLGREASGVSFQAGLRELAERIKTSDPIAMTHPLAYWPVVIEDAELYS